MQVFLYILNYVLQDTLDPIRKRRHELEEHIPEVYQALFDGSDKARKVAAETLDRVKRAIGLDYRNDRQLMESQCAKYMEQHKNQKM